AVAAHTHAELALAVVRAAATVQQHDGRPRRAVTGREPVADQRDGRAVALVEAGHFDALLRMPDRAQQQCDKEEPSHTRSATQPCTDASAAGSSSPCDDASLPFSAAISFSSALTCSSTADTRTGTSAGVTFSAPATPPTVDSSSCR